MKLYWRVKKEGKWTWTAADSRRNPDDPRHELLVRIPYDGVEE